MTRLNAKAWFLSAVAFLPLLLSPAWAQDSSSSPSGAPPAATGPSTGPDIENPPLSGLDQPTSEPAYGGRSYLVPGIQVSESVNGTSSGLASSVSGTNEAFRGLGSLDLQKIWKKYLLGLDYIAGGTVYQGPLNRVTVSRSYQTHTLAVAQRLLWRTGQLAFRDSLSYLPEGSFGFGSYGGAGGFGSALGGGGVGGGAGTGLGGGTTGGIPGSGSLGGSTIGSVGIQPRINNLSLVDITQSLSPRGTLVLVGGYDYTDFLKNAQTSLPLINSQMTSAQLGYDYLLNRHDRISVLYGYQGFHFPNAGSGNVNAHLWHVLYGHRVSGRLNLVFGGGPQLIVFHNPNPLIPAPNRISASGRAQLTYQLKAHTGLQLSYTHYVTPGSGFFAGAKTDTARAAFNQFIGRNWTFNTDVGYSYNTSLQKSLSGASAANTYQYWYGGASFRRQIGRYFGAFVSYQYNDLRFNTTVCTIPSACGTSSARNVGLVGIDWHPHPFRLD